MRTNQWGTYWFNLKSSYYSYACKANENPVKIHPILIENYVSMDLLQDHNNELGYYDYISTGLNQMKQSLQFSTIDSKKIAFDDLMKQYSDKLKHVVDLEPRSDDSELTWVKLQYENGFYVGQVDSLRERNGRGMYSWNGDSYYMGYWTNGVKDRYGRCFDVYMKLVYEGDYSKGSRNGKGVFYFNNGDRYEGEVLKDKRHGSAVNFERVEWVIIRDPQTQFNALQAGEVDMVEQPSFEQYESLKKTAGVKVDDFSPAGYQFVMRFNHLHAPFNNVKIRQAAMLAVGQQAFINTQVGIPDLVRPCKSIYPCGTPLADESTSYFTGVANAAKARELLKEAGYDGTPIVMMRPTDLAAITKLPLVAKQQLEAAGFKVDLQQMDWASLVARRAKKEPPTQGGWNMFFTTWTAQDIGSPLTSAMLNAKGATGWFGWQDEPRIEDLKAKFARAHEGPEQKKIASAIQALVFETAAFAPLGQYRNPTALRSNVSGMLQTAGVPVMWGLSKN